MSFDAEIKSSEDGNNLGLKDLAYAYIKSTSLDDLETNRQALLNKLDPEMKDYINGIWRQKEDRVVRWYTMLNFNLGCHSSQRIESYHVILKDMVNG